MSEVGGSSFTGRGGGIPTEKADTKLIKILSYKILHSTVTVIFKPVLTVIINHS